MTPELFNNTQSIKLGKLTDCTRGIVIEERNGMFEAEIEYSIFSPLWDKLVRGNIFIADANDTLKAQKFRIYKTSKPIRGIFSIYAKHISYDLLRDMIEGINIEKQSCEYALNTIFRNSQFSKHYKGYSDIINAQNFKIKSTKVLSAIAGTEGSIIDTYGTGAEILRDNENISVLNKRGHDNGVTIEYGKNLTGITLDEDDSSMITRIKGYAKCSNENGEEVIVYTTPKYIDSPRVLDYETPFVEAIDFSNNFENDEVPTPKKIKTLVKKYFTNNKCDLPKTNAKISFIPLSKCVGYEDIEDKISLCDIVTIKDYRYNYETKAKVIKTTYNFLIDRYESMEIGEPRSSLGDIITNNGSQAGTQGPAGPPGKDGADGNIEDFPDSFPSTPVLSSTLYGFANIELIWTFENKVYYSYELYASKIKDFTPNTFDLIFQGQASTFLFQAKPNETWYFRVCALNTHGKRTSFSEQISVTTVKVSDLSNYIESVAIGDALIGTLSLDRGWVGELRGNYIDAKQLSVTDGNGKRTLWIDSFGNVNLDVTSLKINAKHVSTTEYVDSSKQEAINSFTTAIGVMQGKITAAINNTQIVKDGKTTLLKDDYNKTVAKVDSINSTIGSHTTQINDLTGNITSVDTKVNSVQRDLEGTKSTVSSHTTQINGLNSTVSTQGTNISQLKDKIALKVEQTDINDAINSANNSTDTKLKKYSTTSQMKTAIEQSAKSIATTVSNTYLSKGDANNVYATKSSLIQTENSITAKFETNGAYNIVENSTGYNDISNGWANTGNNSSKINAWHSTSAKLKTGYYLILDRDNEIDTSVNAAVSRRFKLKPNTTYTVSGILLANAKTLGIKFMVKTSNTIEFTDVENRKDFNKTYTVFSGKLSTWTKKTLTFTTDSDVKSGCIYIEHLGYDANDTGTSANRIYWGEICLVEGDMQLDWSPHPNEVYSGSTVIDASGVTINDGALTIKNNAGTTVLNSDTNGNLLLTGKLIACEMRGKNMIYIENNGTLSCDGVSYIRDLRIPLTHPGWSTTGAFWCGPTAEFDKEVRTKGEFWAANNTGTSLGVIRRGAGGSGYIQIDRLRVVNKKTSNANNYLEIVGYNSNHVFGADLWSSDIKLKENIVSIESNDNAELLNNDAFKTGLDLINDLNHYSFDYKENFGGGHVNCGYIAQELQELNSDLVMEIEQQDGTMLLQPKASNIIPNLSLAIKQQQQMIEDLKAEIEELKSKIRS